MHTIFIGASKRIETGTLQVVGLRLWSLCCDRQLGGSYNWPASFNFYGYLEEWIMGRHGDRDQPSNIDNI